MKITQTGEYFFYEEKGRIMRYGRDKHGLLETVDVTDIEDKFFLWVMFRAKWSLAQLTSSMTLEFPKHFKSYYECRAFIQKALQRKYYTYTVEQD